MDKDEIMNDWNIDSYNSFDEFINTYIYYYNNERLACSLDYKTPIQYKGVCKKFCVNGI